MKVILLGDVHANLPALEACFEQAETEGYHWMAHTGDVVGYGPFPDECVDFLRRRNIPGVRGNFDDAVGAGDDDCGADDPDPEERGLAEASFRWTCDRVDLRTRRWLADLPFEVRHDGGGRRLALFHAGPIALSEGLAHDTAEHRLIDCGSAAAADIIAVGHGDRAFHRSAGRFHFVNPGSVGRPRDGSPKTGYAVIESVAGTEVKITLRRFPYDIARTVRAMEDRGLPRDLAGRLERGA